MITEELKNKLKAELTDQKEKEKLERIEANKKLKKATIYTNKDHKLCQSVITYFTNEGIPFIEKEVSKNEAEWQKVAATTNLGALPTIKAGNEYFVHQRDFQNVQQLAAALSFLANPTFKNSTAKEKTVEHIKTAQYNILNRINKLEKNLNPLMNFLNNLQQQIEEEDK